ncbi:MAG: hypothetical protein ACT4PJ_07820 [Gemmatimonadaceae bacterium]
MMRWPAVVGALALAPAIAQTQEFEPPRTTLLYQNFPNPFPVSGTLATCIWFDVESATDVILEVLDIRGNVVKTLVPSAAIPSLHQAGRYGRGSGDMPNGFGCDGRYIWDGVASNGTTAPAGVYLLRMRAGGLDLVRRMLFLGR